MSDMKAEDPGAKPKNGGKMNHQACSSRSTGNGAARVIFTSKQKGRDDMTHHHQTCLYSNLLDHLEIELVRFRYCRWARNVSDSNKALSKRSRFAPENQPVSN